LFGYNGSKETERFIAGQMKAAKFIIMVLPLVSKVSVFPVHAIMVYVGE
jgi:hypothetical protein